MTDRLGAAAEYLSQLSDASDAEGLQRLERPVVKELLGELGNAAPGNSVELRVPPYGAIQLIAGPRHRRGTPSATIEMDCRTLVELCAGQISWGDALAAGRLSASGARADLSALVPIPILVRD